MRLSAAKEPLSIVREIRRILIIRSGAIGDFIVTLPVVHLLRRAYKSSWLTIVARNRIRPLVKDIVDEFVDIDGPLLIPFFQEDADVHREQCLYVSSFDLIISYLGAEGVVSENLSALGKTTVVNADPLPPPDYNRHITEFLLNPLAEVVDVSFPPFPSATVGEEEKKWAEEFLSAAGVTSSAPTIAVHPGSGNRRKVSPAQNFCRAANAVLARFPGAAVLAIQGEADEQDVSAFERCLSTPCVRVRREDLMEVAAILSRASLFMGNDSGIAHLAAAVEVPTVVVFRASNPAVWAPRGKDVWVASDDSLQDIVVKLAKKLLR